MDGGRGLLVVLAHRTYCDSLIAGNSSHSSRKRSNTCERSVEDEGSGSTCGDGLTGVTRSPKLVALSAEIVEAFELERKQRMSRDSAKSSGERMLRAGRREGGGRGTDDGEPDWWLRGVEHGLSSGHESMMRCISRDC